MRGEPLAPGETFPTPQGAVTFRVISPEQADQVIRELRRQRDRQHALLQLPDTDPTTVPEVSIRPVHADDRIKTLGFSHTRRVMRAMQSRGIEKDVRERASVITIGDQIAWVVDFEIADDFRFRTDEDQGRGLFLDFQVDDSNLA